MTFGAAYIRVSTDHQDEYSPDAQRRCILDYAKKNDIVINKEHIFADIGISGRFVSARNAIAELAEQAKQDMTPEKILAMDTTIKAELNKVFGSDVSSVFFGGLSALALADDGAFVFEKVLEAVAPLVEEAHKAGIAAAEARLKKHTAVYADFSKGLAPGQQA